MWREDGDLILVADGMDSVIGEDSANTGEKTAFRVHRDVVERHAAVFADMFSLPQPPEERKGPGEETVIHLADDPEDLFYFLDAMYDRSKYVPLLCWSPICKADEIVSRYSFSEDTRPSWPVVKALLLLGNKYDAEALREEAHACLQRQYPKDIRDWDKRRAHGSYIDCKDDVLAISVANLARKLRIPELHLPALYHCSTLPPDTITHGALREDSNERVQLDADDVAACLGARAALQAALRANVEDLFEVTPCDLYDEFYCDTPHRCVPATQNVQYHHEPAQTDAIVAEAGPDVLADLRARIGSTFGDACERCVEFYRSRYADSRQEVRDRLDEYFVVPPY